MTALQALVDEATWMEDAKCLGMGGLMFSQDRVEQLQAVLVCTDCPVRLECFLYAMEIQPNQGVWGGFTWKDGEPWR